MSEREALLDALREKAERRGRRALEPGDYTYETPSWEDVKVALDEVDRLRDALWTICKPEYELRRDRVEIAREALDG